MPVANSCCVNPISSFGALSPAPPPIMTRRWLPTHEHTPVVVYMQSSDTPVQNQEFLLEFSECCCGAARMEVTANAPRLEFFIGRGEIDACVIPGTSTPSAHQPILYHTLPVVEVAWLKSVRRPASEIGSRRSC